MNSIKCQVTNASSAGTGILVINDRLNQYGFQKLLPPMQAFQELAMYVENYLTKPTIEEPAISDKTKAEIKGFDEFSFRKPKIKDRSKTT